MIQLTAGRTLLSASTDELTAAREHYERCGFLKLKSFLAPALVAPLVAALGRTEFYDRVHDGIGEEQCAASGAVSGALEFLLNDPVLTAAIQSFTGCGAIGCFSGRVYRLVPGSGHYDSWHSDVGQDRLVALSVNLGREPYEGGVLQIRRAGSPEILGEVENRELGDAVIFRIDPAFRHRVGPVEGRVPRTAYAGWFRARPEFSSVLRRRLEDSRIASL